jgi:integrase
VENLRALLDTCERKTFMSDRDRAIILTLLDAGCRASEFATLNVGNLNLSTGAVLVREGKGGKFRTVFIGAKTRREVLRYLKHHGDLHPQDPLWTTKDGSRLTTAGLRQILRRRAGAPPGNADRHSSLFCFHEQRVEVDFRPLSTERVVVRGSDPNSPIRRQGYHLILGGVRVARREAPEDFRHATF